MLTIFLFIVTSAALFLGVIGTIKSINKEDPFFYYLYSTVLFIIVIGVFIFYAYNDLSSSTSNIENVITQLTALWLFSTLISLISLIINAILRKPIIIPGLISGVSFAMFSIILSFCISIRLF